MIDPVDSHINAIVVGNIAIAPEIILPGFVYYKKGLALIPLVVLPFASGRVQVNTRMGIFHS
ncbi:MAG: hypothetical protein ACR2HF_06150 [Methylococcaceae bacterium]